MRFRSAVTGMLLLVGLGAKGAPTLVRDWGLHRQWRMECDPAHPERPARLVEIPWNAGEPARAPSQSESRSVVQLPWAVRIGMRVSVVRRETMAEIRLRGTALGNGRVGERVAVRTEFGVVHGMVRGPGVVELNPEKDR